MVRGLIQDQAVGTADHHLGQQAAHLLTTGENTNLLHTVFTGEQHTSQETTYISGILHGRVTGQPVGDGHIVVELCGIVLRKVGLGSGNTPLVGSLVRLHFPGQDLEQSSLRQLAATYESHLVFTAQSEGNVIQHLFTVDGLGQMLHSQYLVTDLTLGTEVNIRIFSAGRLNIIQFNFFQCTFSGSSLLGLGSICGETGDKLLQFLDLFFLFLVGFLHLLDQQLARLVPEVVVTGIQLDLAVVDVGDLGTYLVQEVTVMGYYDNGILEINQEIFQPCDRIQIQMVGRLIQQQNVGITEQCLGQQDLHLQAAVQILHERVVELGADAKTV